MPGSRKGAHFLDSQHIWAAFDGTTNDPVVSLKELILRKLSVWPWVDPKINQQVNMSFKNLLIGLFCSGSTLVFGQNPTQFVNDGRLNKHRNVVDAEIFVNNGLVIFKVSPFSFDTQNTLKTPTTAS